VVLVLMDSMAYERLLLLSAAAAVRAAVAEHLRRTRMQAPTATAASSTAPRHPNAMPNCRPRGGAREGRGGRVGPEEVEAKGRDPVGRAAGAGVTEPPQK
jgi:hypothetical protein